MTRSCAPRQDVRRWSTFVTREAFLRETVKAPIKTGWAETDKGQPEKPKRAREVGREGTQVVLSQAATRGKRGGKVVALVDVRRAYFYAPARRRVFVELPPEDYQAGDEHMCGLLQCSLYGTRDAAQNWEDELASTLSDLMLTRRIACPLVWQGCIKVNISWPPCTGTTSRLVENDRRWNSSSSG